MPDNSTVQFKYSTKAAEYYRELLKAEAERRQLNFPPPMASVALQSSANAPAPRPQVSRPSYESSNSYQYHSEPYPKKEEPSSWWNTSKNLLGGVVNKAGEWASSVKESGLMDSIKSGAVTVLDKSKEVGSSVVEKIKDTNIGEKSLDALSSVGSYVSTGASAVYSKVRGTDKTSLYRDMEDVQNDAGEKLFQPEPNSQYGGQPKGSYVPPQGEFS